MLPALLSEAYLPHWLRLVTLTRQRPLDWSLSVVATPRESVDTETKVLWFRCRKQQMLPATLNEAPQMHRAEFSDAHLTKAVALAFVCRCNFLACISNFLYCFDAASSISSLQPLNSLMFVSKLKSFDAASSISSLQLNQCGIDRWKVD